MSQVIRILTNFMGSPRTVTLPSGERVEVATAETWRTVRKGMACTDVVVVDCRDTLIYKLALQSLLVPWRRRPIVAVDIVLRRPSTLRARFSALLKRLLLSRVSLFINYFRDVSGYSRYFGIREERSAFVPFKPNNANADVSGTREEYVFTMGRSLRDYDTFIKAIAGLPFRAAITQFSFERFEGKDETFLWTETSVPENLEILPDTGEKEELLRNLRAAKIVVVPIRGDSLCASGLSTYLDAMNQRKCVIITDGPGASDILTEGQALLVPPHDVDALRSMIVRAWHDDALREGVAMAGFQYAKSLGGEKELIERILDTATSSLRLRARRSG